MITLFIGSNPSSSSEFNIPFWAGSRSGAILHRWIFSMNIYGRLEFINISDEKTKNNKPLSMKQIREHLPDLKKKIEDIKPDNIVSLGTAADKALNMLGIEHFTAPHPNGMNRQLNKKEYVNDMIKSMKDYILSDKVT